MIIPDLVIRNTLNELSVDGDWGCDIPTFFHYLSQSIKIPLNPDQSSPLIGYFWSLCLSQTSFQVGLATNDLKQALVGKATPRRKDDQTDTMFRILDDNERYESLSILLERYGENLRVRTSEEMNAFAITGSHTKTSKLSDLVYTVLTFISRSREQGVTFVELSKMTGFDNKSIFYAAKILIELKLIVKMRTTYRGAITNIAVHRKFMTQCPHYHAHALEEPQINNESDNENDFDVGEEGKDANGLPTFSKLTRAHLTNINLLNNRILKLINCCPNKTIVNQFIFAKIGFDDTDIWTRRHITRFIGRMVDQGFLERCTIPKKSNKTKSVVHINCLRIPNNDSSHEFFDESQLNDKMLEEDINSEVTNDDNGDNDESLENFGALLTMSIEKQILTLIEESGSMGMTINDIRGAIPTINRRTVESILLRNEGDYNPQNLSDLAIKSVTEVNGRERRQRFFVRRGYQELSKAENMSLPPDFISDKAGSFSNINKANGCTSRNELRSLIIRTSGLSSASKATPMKQDISEMESSTPNETPAKRGRPKKEQSTPNETPLKRGRPKKEQSTPNETPLKRGRPKKEEGVSNETPLKRGRPRKEENTPNEIIKRRGSQNKDDLTARETPNKDSDSFQNTSNVDVMQEVEILPTQETSTTNKNILSKENQGESSSQINYHPAQESTISTNENIRNDENEIELITNNLNESSEREVSENIRENAKRKEPMEDDDTFQGQKLISNGTMTRSGRVSNVTNIPKDDISSKRIKIDYNESDDDDDEYVPEEKIEDNKEEINEIDMEVEHPKIEDIKQIKSMDNNSKINDYNYSNTFNESDNLNQDNGLSQKQNDSNYTQVIESPKNDKIKPTSARSRKIESEIRKQRTDLSLHRRMNDIYSAVAKADGIVEGSRELYQVYQNYVYGEMNPKAQEIDRVTMNRALGKLKEQGRLKETIISIPTYTGAPNRRKIVFLADIEIDSEKVRNKKEAIGHDLSTMYTKKPVLEAIQNDAVGIISMRNPRLNRARLPDNFIDDSKRDETRNAILTDIRACAGSYGYIFGKVAKARIVYLNLLQELLNKSKISSIINLEDGIFDIEYFRFDIPIGKHMEMLPWTNPIPEAYTYVKDSDNAQIRIKDLPENLKIVTSDIFKRKHRHINEALRLLWYLKLIEPLERINLTDNENFTNPKNYKSIQLSLKNKISYFKLNRNVSHLLLGESPKFIDTDIIMSNLNDAEKYWDELKSTTISKEKLSKKHFHQLEFEFTSLEDVVKIMERPTSWLPNFSMTNLQKLFLTSFINKSKKVELSQFDQDLQLLSYTCAAPVDIIHNFIENELHKKKLNEESAEKSKAIKLVKSAKYNESIKAKTKSVREKLSNEIPSIKSSEKSKVKRSKSNRKRDELIESEGITVSPIEKDDSTHPEPRYTKRRLLSNVKLDQNEASFRYKRPLEHVVGKPIEEIIEENKIIFPEGSIPRHNKLQQYWNTETEEVLRDSIAIIKARAKKESRIFFNAVLQVFPRLKSGHIKTALKNITERPEDDIYLTRLAQAYRSLWLEKINDGSLIDKNSKSLTEFDLPEHLKLLRTHIDKRALWLDASNSKAAPSNLKVPNDVREFFEMYTIHEEVDPYNEDLTTKLFDHTLPDVTREEAFAKMLPLTINPSLNEENSNTDNLLKKKLAEVTLKVSGYHSENEPEKPNEILNKIGESAVNSAWKALVDNNVIVGFEGKAKPGQKWQFTDSYKVYAQGPWPDLFFADIIENTKSILDGNIKKWPLIPEKAVQATLLNCISNNQIECSVDIDNFSARYESLKSRAIQDDDYENDIIISKIIESPLSIKAFNLPSPQNPAFTKPTEMDETLKQIENAGPNGLLKEELFNLSIDTNLAINSNSTFVAGYDAPRVISKKYGDAWCIQIGENYVRPRQWIDFNGCINEKVWNTVVHAILGFLALNPGIPLSRLYKRLNIAYDRLEIKEVIDLLTEKGYVEQRFKTSDNYSSKLLSLEEEEANYLFIKI